MANVKITELTELSAAELAENDVLPIVDINTDTTKKVTVVSLRSYADANAYSTYVTLNSSINNTQANVNSAEANIIAYAAVSNANLSSTYFAALANDYATYDVLINTIANTNSYITTNYATLLEVDTVQDNVIAAESNVVAVEARRSDNTFYTYNTHSVVSTANIIPSTNNILSLGAPNAVYKDVYVGPGTIYIGTVRLSDTDGALTITSADDSSSIVDTQTSNVTAALNIVQDNVAAGVTEAAAIETRRAANIAGAISTVTTGNLSTARALVSDESGKIAASSVTTVTLGYLDATSSIQNQLNTKAPLADPTFTGLVTASHDLVVSGNLTVNGETTTINSANKVIQDRFIMLANAVSGAPSGDVGIFLNRGTSGNAAIYYDESAKSFTLSETRDPDTNVTIHPTGAANLVVGAFSASTISFNGVDLNTAITDNVASLATATTALETRRTANIAGAVSTITTGDLTVDRTLVSDGSGKVAASTITTTVLGYLDATSSVQTQIDSKQASLAGATLDLGVLS